MKSVVLLSALWFVLPAWAQVNVSVQQDCSSQQSAQVQVSGAGQVNVQNGCSTSTNNAEDESGAVNIDLGDALQIETDGEGNVSLESLGLDIKVQQ